MIGLVYLRVAKARAESLASTPGLEACFAMLRVIERDLTTPGLPRHVVERGLDSQERLVNIIMGAKV